MEKIDDGGPVFPCEYNMSTNDNALRYGGAEYVPGFGLTVRDCFAGQALMGLLAKYGTISNLNPEIAAKESFRYADAMIKARKGE